MNNVLIRNIIRFVLLLLLQVLVFNSMNLSGVFTPAVYVLFVLLLPQQMNRSLVLILSFLMGLSVDFFLSTPGLHATATLWMAFFRLPVLRLFFRNLDFGPDESPDLIKLGFWGFIRYAWVLIFIQHLALFILEVFGFYDFGYTLLKAFASASLTTVVVLILVLLTTDRKRRK